MQINIRSCPSVMKKIAAFAEFSFFACVLLWIETKWKFIKKRQRDLYSALLTEHAWSIKVLLYGKNSALGQKKKMTHLSQELGKKANCVCNKSNLTVFCRFWRIHRQHCPKIKNLFSCSRSKRAIPKGKMGPGFASYCLRTLPAI